MVNSTYDVHSYMFLVRLGVYRSGVGSYPVHYYTSVAPPCSIGSKVTLCNNFTVTASK